MHIAKQLTETPTREVIVAQRYESMLLSVSFIAFLAMAAIFFLILSL